MLTPLMLAIRQLSDPRLLGVLAKSLALTLVLFAAIGAALWWLIMGRDPCALFAGYSCRIGGGSGAIVATLLTLAGLWLLFPAIATGVMGLFSDEVVAAVEERHYPRRAEAARKIGHDVALRMALGSAGRLIGYNLIALPFYLLLLLTAIGPVFLFLAVNGAALGRDLGEMVAIRHLDTLGLRRWLDETKGTRWALGLAVTGLFMVPVANLLAPVLGAAMATHVYHRRNR
jgi:uncharacterized protein involved in cysteine biosynthesis